MGFEERSVQEICLTMQEQLEGKETRDRRFPLTFDPLASARSIIRFLTSNNMGSLTMQQYQEQFPADHKSLLDDIKYSRENLRVYI